MSDEPTRSEIKAWLGYEGSVGLDMSPGEPMCLAAQKLIRELEQAEIVAKLAVDVLAAGQLEDLVEAIRAWKE